jgi:(1->4)-alpha-D-glucan 1-alpha-D-glucosylmutase
MLPLATYRLQFNREFTFRAAAELLDYLKELGISDCYSSPLFRATLASTHGYDVCSFSEINPLLGSAEEFEQWCAGLRDRDMGLILDIVPNHMACNLCNDWWRDVLTNGTTSPQATWFEIDWQPDVPALKNKVLVPILEDHYGRVLDAGKLRLIHEAGEFLVAYYDIKFPVSPATAQMLDSELTHRGLGEVLDHFNRTEALHALLQKQNYRLAYWRVAFEEINYRRFFDVAQLISLRMQLPEVFAAAHQMVFRLIAEGKVTGLRIDHPDGLWDPKGYFARINEWYEAWRPPEREQKAVSQSAFGADLRTERGSEKQRNTTILARAGSKPVSGRDHAARFCVIAEKILTGDEPLPEDWRVDGTTGYDFLNKLNGLFVASEHEHELDAIYRDFTGYESDFEQIAQKSKRQVLLASFGSELNALSRRLRELAALSRDCQDFTYPELRSALIALISCFPVYRTYINEQTTTVSPSDRAAIQEAFTTLHGVPPLGGSANTSDQLSNSRFTFHVSPPVLHFLKNVLLLEAPRDLTPEAHHLRHEFIMRLQQLTGPVAAKGVEDTAFYRYNRLVSLNEVGGAPATFGLSVEAFHQHNRSRAERWPHSLLATATHDTKRGEDTRVRIDVLSEMSSEWQEAVTRWRTLNASKKTVIEGEPAPDANDEYFLYQTLVGCWPNTNSPTEMNHLRERLAAYLLKSLREAKRHTSWIEPDLAYEKAAQDFVSRFLSAKSLFLEAFKPFQQRVSWFGRLNSLSQTLLKLTCPGVADIYQGTELWDFHLVDPDNRAPVDYSVRKKLLAEIKNRFSDSAAPTAFAELLKDDNVGASKLFLIWRILEFRRRNPALLERGTYTPLQISGPKCHHLCAFARMLGDSAIIVIVPRLCFGLLEGNETLPLGPGVWHDTTIQLPPNSPAVQWSNVITQHSLGNHPGASGIRTRDALAAFPVALLTSSWPLGEFC